MPAAEVADVTLSSARLANLPVGRRGWCVSKVRPIYLVVLSGWSGEVLDGIMLGISWVYEWSVGLDYSNESRRVKTLRHAATT